MHISPHPYSQKENEKKYDEKFYKLNIVKSELLAVFADIYDN